jgi:serine/threonine protein kinase
MVAEVNPLELQPGTMVDGWRIVRRIGNGSYAVVYEVEKDGQRFALKLAYHTERSLDPRQVDARAEREVACLQQLKHPHIIRMRAHGRWPDPSTGFLYIILDFVDGDTLARWAERTSPTPHDHAVLFLKLFDALDHIHGHQMFHRDLSFNNIMVTQAGEPVIIDFGVADYASADQLTEGPIPPGTPRNRSPQAQRFWEENRHKPGAHYTFTAADDIFALGVNLYDLLTDPTPARSSNRPPLGSEVMKPSSPWKVTQGRVPMELSAFVMKLISPDLEVRYAAARDARRPLEEFVQGEEPEWRTRSVRPAKMQLPLEHLEGGPAPVQAQQAEGPREPSPVPVLALAALAVLVFAFLLREPPQPQPPPASSTLAEKPTSRPAELASPPPTQQEASPSVKQSDNSPTPTRGTPEPRQPPKATRQPVLSKAQRCALLVGFVEWHAAGCTGVQTRPDPEDCPKEAVRAMVEELEWSEQGGTQPYLIVDVTKALGVDRAKVEMREDPCTLFKDGPVTGALIKAEGKAPMGTRLDGHLWTTGDRIYGRYFRAHLKGGRTVPICLELRNGPTGLPKDECPSKPGYAPGTKDSQAVATDRWH